MNQKILNLQARVAEASVRLGPDNKKTSRIVLSLENLSNKAMELDFGQQGEISLTLRVGKGGEDLVATTEEALGILTEVPKGWQKVNSKNMGDRLVNVFLLPDTVFKEKEEKITLSNFECTTNPGKAVIEINARIDGYEPYASGPLEIEKKIQEFHILFFEANPPYIITEKDRKDFTLTWNTVEAGQVVVYKNSLTHPLLTLVESRKDFENGKEYKHRGERPSFTSVYKLVATDRKNSANEESQTLTVQVLEPGWHSIEMATYGYPTMLCKCNVNNVDKLFGIFVNKGRAYLYSSQYPVSDWTLEHQEVPPGMETSPGVCLNNKLWLVGGSTANPGDKHCSNQMQYYGEGSWIKVEEKANWTPRMGHGCVVFNDKIWILGGFDENGKTLNDVWSFDPREGFKPHDTAPWPARCMFATAVFGGKIWIYGGATAPLGNLLEDMWTSEDGEQWAPYKTIPRDSSNPIGAPIGCAMEVVGRKLNLMGSFRRQTTVNAKHGVLEEGQETWTINELREPWYQWDLNTFSLSAVEYKGLVFLRTISYQTEDCPTKMTLYIPTF